MGVLPIAENDSNTDTGYWSRVRDISVSERDKEGQGSNFEWYDQSLVKEEVPAGQEARRIVHPVPSKVDKTACNRHVRTHSGDRIID